VTVISREPSPIADNQARMFIARLSVPEEPNLDAVVAA